MFGNILAAAVSNGCNTNSGVLNTLSTFLCAGSNIWFPIVLIGVLLVISVVGILYAIAPLLGRTDIRVWARAKIFDGGVTIIFALIFISFSSALYYTPLSQLYYNTGLLPYSCTPQSVATAGASSADLLSQQTFVQISNKYTPPSDQDTLYGIASCDIYAYNQDVAQFVQNVFYFALVAGVSPSITIFPQAEIGFSATMQLVPTSVPFQYIVPLMGALFGLIIASQMLQILVEVSMLLFSIFMVVGLVARSFGITRSFGGAMIAFGLGIGFIYPLLISVSYGFLLNAIAHRPAIGGGIMPTIGVLLSPTQLIGTVVQSMFSAFFLGSSTALSNIANLFTPILGPIFLWGGLVAIGLTIMPLLNLVIVDAFIIDFSRAVGERMDLLSVLTRII